MNIPLVIFDLLYLPMLHFFMYSSQKLDTNCNSSYLLQLRPNYELLYDLLSKNNKLTEIIQNYSLYFNFHSYHNNNPLVFISRQ